MLNATQDELQGRVQAAHEPGHALPPAGDVRRLREPAADAGRLAHQLPARAGVDGVPVRGSRRCGTRPACSTRASATTSWSRAATRPRLVRWRDDRLDAARAGRRPVVPRRRAGVAWTMVAFADGPDADQRRQPLPAIQPKTSPGRRSLKIKLAPGGGWAARITRREARARRRAAPPRQHDHDAGPTSHQAVRRRAARLTAAAVTFRPADADGRVAARRVAGARRAARAGRAARAASRSRRPRLSRAAAAATAAAVRTALPADPGVPQLGIDPGGPPVPPPAASSVPIRLRDLLQRRREVALADRRHEPVGAERAHPRRAMRTPGSAKLVSAADARVRDLRPRAGVGRARVLPVHLVRRRRARDRGDDDLAGRAPP